MIIELLTKELQDLDIEAIREEVKKQAIETWQSKEEVEQRFLPGTHGHHELSDRACLAHEHWNSYITHHPSNIFVPGAAILAQLIENLTFEYYQMVACRGLTFEQATKNREPGTRIRRMCWRDKHLTLQCTLPIYWGGSDDLTKEDLEAEDWEVICC